MPNNALVTGPPRSGKTTVVLEVMERLESVGLQAGGIVCPEVREGERRVGFEIVDVLSGDSRVLAHVNHSDGPTVGKYAVDVPGIDEISERAFPRALADADYVVVDEIAPMETHSRVFVTQVSRVLDGEVPVVAAVHYRRETGFIGRVKRRYDTEVYEVTRETRDGLPRQLAEWVCERV